MFSAWCSTRRTVSDKMLCDKAFDIAKIPKYDGYQWGLDSMVYIFLIKKLLLRVQINLLVVVLKMRTFQTRNWHKNNSNQLSKKIHSPFSDNIWVADLANMQLISKFKKRICFFLLYIINILSKYGSAIPLKDANQTKYG